MPKRVIFFYDIYKIISTVMIIGAFKKMSILFFFAER